MAFDQLNFTRNPQKINKKIRMPYYVYVQVDIWV